MHLGSFEQGTVSTASKQWRTQSQGIRLLGRKTVAKKIVEDIGREAKTRKPSRPRPSLNLRLAFKSPSWCTRYQFSVPRYRVSMSRRLNLSLCSPELTFFVRPKSWQPTGASLNLPNDAASIFICQMQTDQV